MKPFQRRLLLVSSLLTGLTGLVYWWMKYRMEPMNEWSAINHPLQPWALKAHILVAPVMVFALGLVASDHIWRHLRSAGVPRRRTGLTLTIVLIPMVFSGYLIQAVTHPGWLAALAWVHLVTGSVYLVGILLHPRKGGSPASEPGATGVHQETRGNPVRRWRFQMRARGIFTPPSSPTRPTPRRKAGAPGPTGWWAGAPLPRRPAGHGPGSG